MGAASRAARSLLGQTLKRPSRRDASGKHRQRKEERRAQPENSLRRGRAECAARSPPAVAGASLGIPPERPPLEEFERSEHHPRKSSARAVITTIASELAPGWVEARDLQF